MKGFIKENINSETCLILGALHLAHTLKLLFRRGFKENKANIIVRNYGDIEGIEETIKEVEQS